MKQAMHASMVRFLFSALLILSPRFTLAGEHPLDSLAPGHWLEVPSSRMRDVCPPNNFFGQGYDWNFHCQNAIGAWSGGAYDSTRDRLMIWGGGHTDYAGNEVYVFDVSSLAWQRLDDPSDLRGFCDGSSCTPQGLIMPDGRPPSRHTYDGLQYLPQLDRFWSQGGSLWQSGDSTNLTWTFDPGTLGWTRLADAPDTGLSIATAYDPVTGHIFQHGTFRLTEYDPVLDQWTSLTDTEPFYPLGTNGVIDPARRWMVLVGLGNVFFYDLAETPPLTRHELVTTGDTEIVASYAPGLEYDPISDRLVAWSGEPGIGLDPGDVYLLDLGTLTWTRRAPTLGNPSIPTQASATGTFGRFRYIPSRNAFVVVNSVDDPVFFYRLSAATGPLVFADGFESGSTSSWSSTVGLP